MTIDLVGRRVINVDESEIKVPGGGDQGVELDPLGDGLACVAAHPEAAWWLLVPRVHSSTPGRACVRRVFLQVIGRHRVERFPVWPRRRDLPLARRGVRPQPSHARPPRSCTLRPTGVTPAALPCASLPVHGRRCSRAQGGTRGRGILGNARIQHEDDLEMAPPGPETVATAGGNNGTAEAASGAARQAAPLSADDDFWDFAGAPDAGALPGLLPSYSAGSSAGAEQGPSAATGGNQTTGGVVAQDAGLAGSPQACLCVDQPMASLLVAGVRRFIGLPWRTQHNGRLWIVSTDATPSQGQVGMPAMIALCLPAARIGC